ncbi:Signal peptidase I [Novipirellula galeiformis]|uniref:Signal peptidase I n=1 Tax=Novipirellula galeiformis TaxID=2528004 RepID=A0A5C6CEX1_9BACT|nr:signal peptidase I [Novipirellula galeiformis]TWU23160.1 Signal peptidase I [Novipirellula galeiformis]
MNRKNKKDQSAGTESGPEIDRRDPAEIRAERFRMSGQRETVEAFVVAFILALLFRAFLAEAFVIPTGSMAPTLMGAHKDLVCDRCGNSFQVGASLERRGPTTDEVVVAGICPNCRHVNSMDLAGTSDHETFNGDRILVSKFAYTISEPERWDVIVFKFPGNPKQNYIKRLVGLPNETLTIHHGDVYQRPTGSDARDQMIRKPADKLLAMRQLVHDTSFQSPALIAAKYPSRWQPWNAEATSPPADSWKVDRSEDGLTATLDQDAAARVHWLRYYHRWPDQPQWDRADKGLSLADVDPYSSRLITDFYAYGSYVTIDADRVYDYAPSSSGSGRLSRLTSLFSGGYSTGQFSPSYKSGAGPEQFGGRASFGSSGLSRDGVHWVGDLILEADVETSADSKEVVLELVEAGVPYRCSIDLSTGVATLSIGEDETRTFDLHGDETNLHPSAPTSVRAGSRHRVRMSNCDDQILLWVDDELVEFDAPTTFDVRSYLSDAENHPKYVNAGNPLDAAPAGVGVRGGTSSIRHLRIDRDKYYIATKAPDAGMFDYDVEAFSGVTGGLSSHFGAHQLKRLMGELQDVMAQPELWSDFTGWQARRSVSFELEQDQFFPMGDNSPESLDARAWAGTKLRPGMTKEADAWARADYVPRDLLVGKALLVFWPHSWNSPVPFTPNFRRMKLIR